MINENMTGYASIDKPWLKYYRSPESFVVPRLKNFDYIYKRTKQDGDRTALRYFSASISYDKLFNNEKSYI